LLHALIQILDVGPVGFGEDGVVESPQGRSLKRQKIEIIYIYKRLCPRKKIRNRYKKLFLMKLNTKLLKFNKMQAVADRERGGQGGGCWWTRARHGYSHLVFNNVKGQFFVQILVIRYLLMQWVT
jgi:hypothetical protein